MAATGILESIDIKSPCQVPWSGMRGDDRTRFCTQCRQTVFNISEMTRPEAEELIRANHGHLCVRYYYRADGTVVTKNCAGPKGIWRRRIAIAAALFFAMVGSAFGWLMWTNRGEHRYDTWARRTEPFRTVLNWIDPPPVQMFMMMGTIAVESFQPPNPNPPVAIPSH